MLDPKFIRVGVVSFGDTVINIDQISSIKPNFVYHADITLKEIKNGQNVVISTLEEYSTIISLLDSMLKN